MQQRSFFFHALLKEGADHTKQKSPPLPNLWQSRESDSIDICAVHAKRALLPSKPWQGNALWRPC